MNEAKKPAAKKSGAKNPKIPVPMVAVQSSNIAEIGYDGANETLYVKFTSGATYAYTDVPEKRAMGLLNATSKGEYFADHIKNDYPHVKA